MSQIDVQTAVAEMLAKAINHQALDAEVSLEDRERLLELVSSFGNLSEDYTYQGSARAGYHNPRGAALKAGESYQPIDFSELLRSDFWDYKLYFGEGYDQAATMLEPVGGMDRIAQAFERQVGSMIQYGTQVKEIRQTPRGVQVIYSGQTGTGQIEADYAICTFPLPVLAKIETNFSPPFQQAIKRGAENYANVVKVGFQANRRFWEEEDYIYGGISWTERDITQIWYPSSNFHQEKGILVGAYIWDNEISKSWGRMLPEQRLQRAIADAEAIHPNYRREVSPATGVTVAWENIPYSLGGWAEWKEEDRESAYRLLNQPEGAVYLAGEHLSYLTGWQEGAVLSAHHVIQSLVARTQARG